MTQTTKVNISQWLIVIASALFGVWGGYSVLKYKVAQNEKGIKAICDDTIVEKEKVWDRLEDNRIERQDNKDNITAIKYDVKAIKHEVQSVSNEQRELRSDVKKILEKVE